MKYNENAFDKIMESYELDGIVTEKVVRSDAVKNRAFEQLGLGSKKKKSHKKVFRLIAAAAAAAIIGTSVIAANPIKDAFKDYIGIPDDVFVYAGDNVQITSDKANVEVKGVVCDDTMLFAMLEITKKDGTPFTDDISNSYVEADVKHQQVLLSENKPDTNNEEELLFAKCGTVEYNFADENTIKAFVKCDNSGKTLEIHESKLFIYQKGETIYKYSDFNSGQNFDRDVYESQTAKIEEKYAPMLSENQFLTKKGNCMYIETRTEIDIDYTVKFDVNCIPQMLTLDVDKNKSYQLGNGTLCLESVEIHPFSTTIIGTRNGILDFNKLFGHVDDGENKFGAMEIELKDGTILKTGLEGGYRNADKEHNPENNPMKVIITFREYTDDDNNIIAINTDNIKAVYFCGEKIYG